MNTNDDKIQWHPAFDAALQIELEAEAEYLEFEPEHLLSKKPIQLIVIPKLSKENNYWLNNLRNDLKSGGEIRNFIEQYGKNKNSKLYQALADTIMRANWEELREERKMCEALRELFADDLRESREEGIIEGRNAGKIEGKLEGKIEGKLEGSATKIIEQVVKKYQKGCTVEETADMLEESPNLIKQIYDVIRQDTHDLAIENVYRVLLEKAVLSA